MPFQAILREVDQLHSVSTHLEALAERHPSVSRTTHNHRGKLPEHGTIVGGARLRTKRSQADLSKAERLLHKIVEKCPILSSLRTSTFVHAEERKYTSGEPNASWRYAKDQSLRFHKLAPAPDEGWLDLDGAALVEVTSEDKEYPVESRTGIWGNTGWRAAGSGGSNHPP